MSNEQALRAAIKRAIKLLTRDNEMKKPEYAKRVGMALGVLKSTTMLREPQYELISSPPNVSLEVFSRMIAEEVRQKFAELSRAKELVSED